MHLQKSSQIKSQWESGMANCVTGLQSKRHSCSICQSLNFTPILSRQVTQNTEIQWSSCSLVPSSSAVRPIRQLRPDVIPQPANIRDVTLERAAASASCYIPETARHQGSSGPCSHPSHQPHQQHHTRLIAGWQINWPRRRSYTCLKGRP